MEDWENPLEDPLENPLEPSLSKEKAANQALVGAAQYGHKEVRVGAVQSYVNINKITTTF